jgi:DNA-3-methyladenine glycosylase II
VPRVSLSAAVAEIAQRDRVMAGLIRAGGPMRLPASRGGEDGHFRDLAESIVYQQLTGKVAQTIHGRFVALFGGSLPTPEAVLAVPEASMRAAGLSAAKTASIKDLAMKVAVGTVPLARLVKLPDQELIDRLTVVRGIGRWTAEMFLIFRLRRLDVWPVDDYGVRTGYRLAYGLDDIPTAKELAPEGDRFRPYRTVAAWYLWRAVHLHREGKFPNLTR